MMKTGIMQPFRLTIFTSLALLVLYALFSAPVSADYFNQAVSDSRDAAYWLDRGGLYATYGSYEAAVSAYEKALSLEPDNSKAYFNLGLAYAALGKLNQAITVADRAITLESENGRYYYGRAWILMQAGKKDEAMADFHKAAEMGDLDAIAYLQP